jgi:hypothetical protein
LPEGRLVPEPWPAVTAWDDQDTSVLPRAA